jgi:hypothetical protein
VARERGAGCKTERVVNAVEDGIWLANQIYDKALLRFGQGISYYDRAWSSTAPGFVFLGWARLGGEFSAALGGVLGSNSSTARIQPQIPTP